MFSAIPLSTGGWGVFSRESSIKGLCKQFLKKYKKKGKSFENDNFSVDFLYNIIIIIQFWDFSYNYLTHGNHKT